MNLTLIPGSVVDIRFDGHLPPIYSVLRAGAEQKIVIEVLAQRDARHVRGIQDEAWVKMVTDIESDVHSEVGLSCHDCHGGNPDPKLAEDPFGAMDSQYTANPYRGATVRNQVPEFCGRCHADAEYMKRFKPDARVDQLNEYWTSQHGKLLKTGDTQVATCVDCHGTHTIRRPSDAQSPRVYPTAVAETCRSCHSDPKRMAGYKLKNGQSLPIDQYERWRRSVHATAMFEKDDLSAPTCNDCHGNHAAVSPTLTMLGPLPDTPCAYCHEGGEAAVAKVAEPQKLVRRYRGVKQSLLAEANAAGVPADARFDWLVDQALSLPDHRRSRGRDTGAAAMRHEFERLFQRFRISKTYFTYPDPVTGRPVQEKLVRCTDCHGSESTGAEVSDTISRWMKELTVRIAKAQRTLLAMFNTPQLKGVAQEVEDTIVKIMQEAAAG